MQAALTACGAGLSVIVADEGPGPGGQIYRAVQHATPAITDILGADYAAGRDLADAVMASAATRLFATTAWMIERARAGDGYEVGLSAKGRAKIVSARAVIIATGAMERPFPIPGWTLPGVMSAGAAQTLLKASGLVPEGPTILAGTGPLLWLLAAQWARAGAAPATILDTAPSANWRAAWRHLPGFLGSPYFRKGLALLAKARQSTRVISGVTALAAHGEQHVTEVTCRAGGRTLSFPTCTLLLHQGVVPQIHLAMAAGVPHIWNATRLCFEPDLHEDGATVLPGLYIAGDSSGIGGAIAAREQGALAALAAARQLGRIDASRHATLRAPHARALAHSLRGRAFLDALYRPADVFRMPADDVIICRCEEVSAGAVRAATLRGAQGPNQLKAFLRAGMGPCQGRLCGLTVTEIMAQASGRSPAEIGHFRLRIPVKPVTVGEFASLDEA
jgi:thioredoxin reductase